MKQSSYIIISLCALLLCSCQWPSSSPTTQQFQTYLSRIANVQEVDALASPKPRPITLPAKRQLKQPIEPVSMGLMDSYEFRECQLFHLIAKHNSILGKVEDGFRGLDYQLRIIHGLQQCQNNPAISAAFRHKVHQLAALKQRDIAKHWYNFLYTSDAMRRQMTSQRWYQDTLDYGKTPAAFTQLQHVQQWIAGRQWQSAPPAVTSYQETLDKHPLIGDVAYSMRSATQWLDVITEQLKRYDSRIWCGPNTNRTRLEHLRNVFQRFFIGDIQPYLARLDSAYLAIEPSLTLLLPLPPSQSEQAPLYHLPIHTIHDEFRHAITHHITYWQTLFKRCSVPVGRDP